MGIFTNWPFSLKYASDFLLLKGQFCSETQVSAVAYLSVVFHKSLNWRGLNQILLWKFNVAQPHRILDCLAWGGKACGTTAHKQAQQLNSCYWREWGSCISALTAARKVSLFLNYPCDAKFLPLGKKPQPPRALDRHSHWALSLAHQPHPISPFKANKIIRSANCK